MECPLDTPSSSSAVESPLNHHHLSPFPCPSPTSTEEAHPGEASEAKLLFCCPSDNCQRMFERPSDLKKHKRCHVRPHQCEVLGCAKAFSTTKDLKRHMKTHEKEGDGYLCPVVGCKKSGHLYNRKDNYVRHLRKRHCGLERGFVEDGNIA